MKNLKLFTLTGMLIICSLSINAGVVLCNGTKCYIIKNDHIKCSNFILTGSWACANFSVIAGSGANAGRDGVAGKPEETTIGNPNAEEVPTTLVDRGDRYAVFITPNGSSTSEEVGYILK